MKLSLLTVLIVLLSFSACRKDEVTRVNLNYNRITLKVGEKDTLLANLLYDGDINKFPITWSSSSTSIVQVSGGIINAISEGSATITAEAGGKTAKCQITVIKKNTDFVFTKTSASFWGDYFKVGSNNLTMYLLENTLSIDPSGNLQGTGSYLYIDFNIAASDSTLSEGTYSIANTRAPKTFIPGDTVSYEGDTFVIGTNINTIGSNAKSYIIKDGYYKISKDGSGFKIEGQLISTKEEIIQFTYNGSVDLINKIKPVYPALTQADLYYWGDIYTSKTANNFTVLMGDKNINMDNMSGNGDMLMLELNTALSVTNTIPDGTYEMMAGLQIQYLLPNTLVPGYSSSTGNKWGSWYIGKSTEALLTGNATFTKTGDIYNINYQLFNDIKTKVSGTFSGKMRYFNYSSSSSSVKAEKMRQLQTQKEHKNLKQKSLRRMILTPVRQ
ncbi:Ig domain protein group 2 domain protein [Paludibacter propionicigenes WB4]|uniref:Ig domain protein group 2 domain protein n=1 Tax=Paludibacter propionicigenes (strain DSM 17365 / JCM 13257 / WB4) TaxID=694427 RepID=E4T1E9_PALPW|nr:Ig-like domain-containing protein [Paludibacter propionicigenes]ADQ78543.1 Ig domain protein group 2 domain protein [Paludibacter propionicigenes WB4]